MSARSEKAQLKLQSAIVSNCKCLATEKKMDLVVVMGCCGADKAKRPGRSAFWVQPEPFRTSSGNDFGIFEISLEECVHTNPEDLEKALYSWVTITADQWEHRNNKLPDVDQLNAAWEGLELAQPTPAKTTRQQPTTLNSDHTLRIGKDAGTGKIWLSQQLGAVEDPREEVSLADLGAVALELEVQGDNDAAEFVCGMVERIEQSPLSQAIEDSYFFPGTTS